MTHKPLVLIILDGWGYRKAKQHNAIAQANTPFFDWLWKTYPHSLLDASQEAVGLPKGTFGNSEIGHMTMGAGKIIDNDLVRISKAIKAGGFEKNPAFQKLFAHIKKHNSALHILGLLSSAGVHSHQDHLHAFLKAAKKTKLDKVIIHAFTDGRDSPPQEAHKYLRELETVIKNLGIGFIATASGRYFAMDRDKNWHRTAKAERALFECKGNICKAKKPSAAMKELYKQGMLDEYLEPLVFLDDDGKGYPISKNDGVFFFNFRSDRTRQLSQKIAERAEQMNLCFVTMTEYHPNLKSLVAFPSMKVGATLAEEISRKNLKQTHIAETDKYAHVTYFFNGGRQQPHKGERHILIPTRKGVATPDLAPQMRAKEIADAAIRELQKGTNFILLNFANADLVGHTANKPAIIKAVEFVDRQLKRIFDVAAKKDATVVITADHGNAEVNIDAKTKQKHTAHTLNLVPFILVSPNDVIPSEARNPLYIKFKGSLHSSSDALVVGRDDRKRYLTSLPSRQAGKIIHLKSTTGSLADVAPTILQLMHLPKPTSMTGKSLI